MKLKIIVFLILVLPLASCNSSVSDIELKDVELMNDENIENEEEEEVDDSVLLVGATLGKPELGTKKEELFLKHFSYLTPANESKQSAIHATPTSWRWEKIEEFIAFAKQHNLVMRLHGPVSPQASKWAKEDVRTPEELELNMTEFMTESAKKFNDVKLIKWMDVVNETVLKGGEWFGPKEGTDKWENPWLHIGLNNDGYPIYIVKAFEIATEYAPNIKLIYNQNSGMDTLMWNKVKKTILYLKSKGLRVDGVGWQGHLMLGANRDEFQDNLDDTIQKLSELIDWCHQNDMGFHVTELDYLVREGEDVLVERENQKNIYQAIADVLIAKKNKGEVTLNLWNVGERNKEGTGSFQSIYDIDFNTTPAFEVINSLLTNTASK